MTSDDDMGKSIRERLENGFAETKIKNRVKKGEEFSQSSYITSGRKPSTIDEVGPTSSK